MLPKQTLQRSASIKCGQETASISIYSMGEEFIYIEIQRGDARITIPLDDFNKLSKAVNILKESP